MEGRALVIRGGRVLDAERGDGGLADILVVGDAIAEVGPPGLAAPPEAEAVSAAGRLIVPGLVNAHTHGHGALAKGVGDRWSLELLLNAASWVAGGLTLDDKRLAARLNAAEMVRKGATAAYDLFAEFPAPTLEGVEALCQGYLDVGVRVVAAPMMADRSFHRAIPGLIAALPERARGRVDKMRAAPMETSLAACRALLEGWPFDRERAVPALAPTIPLHCSDAFMVACRDLAAEHGVGLHMHLAESKVQAVAGLRTYGKTLTNHIDDLGLLGPSFTAAHGNWLDADDIARLADRGAWVAHNPGSNLRLGTGIAPVRALLDAGVGVGVGSDGSVSADSQNLFEAMRLAAFVSRPIEPDPHDWVSAEEAFRMATLGGAEALGLAIGRIAPGFKADLVFLDLGNVNYVPLNDPLNQVVYCEDSSAVAEVMIGGRWVLRDGRFTTFDYDRLVADIAAAVERLRAVNAETRRFAEALADHVRGHCIGLARAPYPVRRVCG